MIVTLIEMKDYLGELTTDYDDFLTQQLVTVQASVESYCGRKFELASYSQTFYRDEFDLSFVPDLYLFHYPVPTITTITEDTTSVTEYRLRKENGRLQKTPDNIPAKWFSDGTVITIDYDGGYDIADMPPEIRQAIFSLVEESYNKKKSGVAMNFGSNVQRVSVAGVMSIDFDYTLQSNERSNAFGMILGDWMNVLDFFRSERSLHGEIRQNYL